MSCDMIDDVNEVRVPDPRVGIVLRWWDENQRDLPWRAIRDPWAILVSEIMAQQTQVDRVVPKWRAFLERFPDASTVASGPVSDVIEMWDGLGYNRRAVMLHRCAVHIVEQHGGDVPADIEGLLALPGIGPYTARAVLAFAFELDVGVLDTNIGRILARWSGETLSPTEAQQRADMLVPAGGGWAWNQALLDFAALLCAKRHPSCVTCPARDCCSWRGVGDDPAVGSASVSNGQSTFIGSDRQGRGRLVAALRTGPVAVRRAGEVMGWTGDAERVERVIAGLIDDSLIERIGLELYLSGASPHRIDGPEHA